MARMALAVVAALVTVGACSRQPTGPSNIGPGVPATGGLSAKPPGSAPHTVAFAQVPVDTDGQDPGHIQAGSQTLLGSITGSDAAGTLRAVVSGTYTWTITRVHFKVGATGNSCTDSEKALLADRELVG